MIRDVPESSWNRNMSHLSSYWISISNHVMFTFTSPGGLTATLTWLVNEFFSFSFLQPSLMTQSNLLYMFTSMHIIYQSLSITSNRGSVFCSRTLRRWVETSFAIWATATGGNEEMGGYHRRSIYTSVGYLYCGYQEPQQQAVADKISL